LFRKLQIYLQKKMRNPGFQVAHAFTERPSSSTARSLVFCCDSLSQQLQVAQSKPSCPRTPSITLTILYIKFQTSQKIDIPQCKNRPKAVCIVEKGGIELSYKTGLALRLSLSVILLSLD